MTPLAAKCRERKVSIVRKIGKRLWLFLAVLMMALTISPAAFVYASGGGGGSGGVIGPNPGGNPDWTLPPITKRIVLPDNKTKFKGNVKFNIKVTLLGYGQNGLQPLASKAERNVFTIFFSGNEMATGNSVERDYDINTLAHQMVSEMEKKLLQPGGGGFIGGGGGSTRRPVIRSKPYDRILVEVSESESSGNLTRLSPDDNTVRMQVQVIKRFPTPHSDLDLSINEPEGPLNRPKFKSGDIVAPKVDIDAPDINIEGPEDHPDTYRVIADKRTFTNQYNPDTPDCPNVCPNPGQGNCKQNNCTSGCPDINININNQNNSSANNNNVNNNTNVGRDQYNVNQAANPNLKLNRYNHFAYVHGYPDHSFRPEGSITRGEMTAIFRRLLDQGIFSGGNGTQFRDVRAGDWYASDVARLSSLGVIAGYPDGTFRPNASVTRAEFANVASKFVSAKSGQSFSDLNGHWAQGAIEKLKSAGWVTGYGDGSFRPDSVITRAEVVSITNRMLERAADANYVRNNRGSLIQYTDLPSGHWAYLPIMEASNAHDYTRNADGSETWTRNWR